MKVSEVMTEDVVSCGPRESLDRAARIMWERDCGSVPIVDEKRRPIGIVTDRDVCMAAYLRGKPLGDVTLQEVMSQQVNTCRPDDDVTASQRLLREHQVRRLPVVDGAGTLVGILSLNDLIRCNVGKDPKADKELLATLSEVGRPRSADKGVVLPREKPPVAPAPVAPAKNPRARKKNKRSGGA